ncbi:MAG TPA: metallophosphoesterase [Flavisolibacter sp.]|nr:metallophosphoesterase [Flavisolibacter sp.]
MIFSIIHFSDIHFKVGHNVISNRKLKLFDALKNEVKDKEFIFLLTSGDIAFSGNEIEYRTASDFYNFFKKEIKNYSGVDCEIVSVPGNHDCDFLTPNEEVRKIILKDFSRDGLSDISDHLIGVCCSHQSNYFKFRNQFETERGDVVFDYPLLRIMTLKVGESIIKFNLFNTSWDSSMHEKVGNLQYPLDFICDRIPSVESLYAISVIHHPLNWQTPDHSKTFRKFLLETSDLIISGHEHSPDSSIIADFDQDYNTIHIESPALQDAENERNSGFNIINLDTDKSSIQIISFVYSIHSSKYEVTNQPEWREIEKNKKLKGRNFQLKKAFLAQLEDPGAKFSHTQVDDIRLSDIFIPPFFKNLTLDKIKKSRLFTFEHSDSCLQLPDESATKFLKLVLGSDSSGKTSLLKYFYLKYYSKGVYPVYLAMEKINDVGPDGLKKVVGREFKLQYDELEQKFEEIDFDNIIILLDDFNRNKNKRAKVSVIKNLSKLFNKILVTASEETLLETYTDKENNTVDPFEEFDLYIIQEFNPSLRSQLITKWYRIGIDYMDADERNAFFRKLDKAANTITTIIGKNFIPSFPVYILTILQGMESGESDAKENKLHAYYYEFLITNSLKNVLSDKDEIGFYMTLAREYCYFLFKERIRFNPISEDSFYTFLKNHSARYSISKLNFETTLQTLFRSKILRKNLDGTISIAYKYLYYFFVAKYLSDNLDKQHIKEEVELMADRVYRDEYSNILVFLSHLARNNFVIKMLIQKSRGIFSDMEPAKLESDVDFVNELQKTLPEQVLRELDVEEARKEELYSEDKEEQVEKEIEERSFRDDYDLNEDIRNIDLMSQLTRALRTINILGQLAKKYWGELLGDDKYDLAEETLMLGLRTLKMHYSLLDDGIDVLTEHVMKIVQKRFVKEKYTREQVQSISENLIFSLASAATFGVFKRIANAIGSEKLSDTFEKLGHQHPYNSTEIVNVGIKLDHYSSFPMNDIEKLRKKNDRNPLGFSVLQSLVLDYLYMYEVSYDKKQRICDMLNIKLGDQRFIDRTSPIKKTSST